VDIDRLRVRPEPHRPVEVQVMGNGFLDVFNARDVGQTGLGILVPHGFEGCDLLGDVKLIVTLPGSPSFFAEGNLRHRTRHGALSFFGVELTRISQSDRLKLRAYVTARHAEESALEESKRSG
jgi:hypothetical protein